MRIMLMLSIAFVVACESGVNVVLDVTLPADASASFTADAPAIVRVQFDGGGTSNIGALCGQPIEATFTYRDDFGFGCLDKEKIDTDEPVVAWIEPLPSGWDPAPLCAEPLPLGEDVPLVEPIEIEHDPLLETPTEDLPQGTGNVSWRRNITPCGGIGEGSVTIAP